MADVSGPDIVGLLANEVSYGACETMAGASEPVQRVPMVLLVIVDDCTQYTSTTFKTPDAMPTILHALGIEQNYPTDGRTRALNR